MSGSIWGRRQRSFPLFGIGGSIVGIGFISLGVFLIHTFLNTDPSKQDSGMLYAGIFFLILGIPLVIGVIYTFLKLNINPNDLSLKVDVSKVNGKKKYEPHKLLDNIERSRNNVLLFNTEDGQMKVFGRKDNYITEIYIDQKDSFLTYQLTDPSVTDESPVIIENIFLERFTVRKIG